MRQIRAVVVTPEAAGRAIPFGAKRIVVCGGRTFGQTEGEVSAVREFLRQLNHRRCMIIHGNQDGLDKTAAKLAKQMSFPVANFDAHWRQDGGLAGPGRNARMLDVAEPHVVVGFPGGRGTANMLRQATERDIPVVRVLMGEVGE